MKSLKVVQVTPFYSPEIGGMERIVRLISEGLARRGHKVTVYTYNLDKQGRRRPYPPIEKVNGVLVKRVVPFLKLHYGTVAPQLLPSLKREECDVLHVHGYRHFHTEQAWFAKQANNTRTILHGHSPFYPREVTPFLAWVWYQLYDKFAKYTVFNHYDQVIALTPHEKKMLEKRGCPPEKITVIPNPLQGKEKIMQRRKNTSQKTIKQFKKNHELKGDSIILYLGRMTESKRIGILVKTLPLLSKYKNDAQLILAGPNEGQLAELMHLAEKLNVEDRLKYLGVLTEREKTLAYLSSDVYVLPSRYEGFGITLLEAQAHGLPVVAFKGGGQEYAVSNGILLDELTAENVVKGILEAYELEPSPELNSYCLEEYVNNILKVYKK